MTDSAYVIRSTLEPGQMNEGRIECYPWGGSYRPETIFRAGWSGETLRVCMECREHSPRRTVTRANGSVWCDSCMEFFLAPGPRAQDGYFNFEMNANGALLLGFGVSDTDFVFSDFPRERISLKAEVLRDRWTLDLRIPFDLIRRHMPAFEPAHGQVLHGNFYKCGDETDSPHFGCYFPIDALAVPEPCFHRPEYYGRLILE